MLVTGEGGPALVRALLMEGIDAQGLGTGPGTENSPAAPERFQSGSLTVLPFPDAAFDTVVSLGLVPDDAPALAECCRVTRSAVLVATRSGDRGWWETQAFAAGLRRHPLWPMAAPFGDLDQEDDGAGLLLLLERRPVPAQEPPAFDGLRVSSRRADALAAVWNQAVEFAHAGHRVLDVAGGTGWGLAILARRREVARCVGLVADVAERDYADRQYGALDSRLSFPADGAAAEEPFDLVVAVAPPDPVAAVAEARSRLKPGGRLVIAVPAANGGAWAALRPWFDDDLTLDRQFSVKEGRSPREPEAPRELIEIDPDTLGPELADWAVAVAVRSPFVAIDPEERQRRVSAEAFHVRASWRDYDNPHLVEAFVSMGSRVNNPRLLATWAARILAEGRPGSADQGAALCVGAYALLEDATTPWGVIAGHLERIAAWLALADDTWHARRWRVSLHYARALLLLRGGRLTDARDAFARCLETDIKEFSATLGTKTVSACLRAGRLSLTLGDATAARAWWQRGLVEARDLLQGDWRNVWGDVEQPFWVEMREVADVVDLAVTCANSLNALATHAAQPGLLHDKRDWGRSGLPGRIGQLERGQARLHSEVFQLQQCLRDLERDRAAQTGGQILKILALRGAAFLAAGDVEQADACFAAAERRDPRWGAWFSTQALLRHGLLAQGWARYERRFTLLGLPRLALDAPEWRGEDLAGRRILVWREQALGEELMFASCLPDLIAHAKRVVIACDRRLVPLFARSFPNAEVRAVTDALPEVDFHVPLGSLPRYFRPDLARFPRPVAGKETGQGWLRADPDQVAQWRHRLADDDLPAGTLTVGLCWRGGKPGAPFAPLERWAPVLTQPGIRVVSLQYAADEAEIVTAEEALGVSIIRWTDLDTTNDLDGLAALMTALDLVITAPTSVGELAGALGVPVWRCGWSDDWAMLGTTGRPWYPTMLTLLVEPDEPLDAAIDEAAGLLSRP